MATGRVGENGGSGFDEQVINGSTYWINDDNSIVTVDDNGDPQESYLIPDISGGNISSTEKNPARRIETLFNYYKSTGQLKELTALLTKKYPELKRSLPGDKLYMDALKLVAASLTNYNYLQTKSAPNGSTGGSLSLLDYLKQTNLSGGSGAGKASSSVSLTGKKTAWDTFRSATESLTGMKPNPNDFNKFYAELSKAEKKYVTRGTSGNNQVVTRENFDLADFTLRYIVGKTSFSEDLKGKLGYFQDYIQQSIKDSGLSGKISAKSQMDMVKGLATGRVAENDVMQTLRDKAALTYTAFADDIKSNKGLTVAQILEPYSTKYASVLEESNFDMADVVAKATGQDGKKIGSGWDFEKVLRNDKRYSYTKQANAEATDVAKSFARAFGVNI